MYRHTYIHTYSQISLIKMSPIDVSTGISRYMPAYSAAEGWLREARGAVGQS